MLKTDVFVWLTVNCQAVFPTYRKSRDKNVNILRTKRAFEMK